MRSRLVKVPIASIEATIGPYSLYCLITKLIRHPVIGGAVRFSCRWDTNTAKDPLIGFDFLGSGRLPGHASRTPYAARLVTRLAPTWFVDRVTRGFRTIGSLLCIGLSGFATTRTIVGHSQPNTSARLLARVTQSVGACFQRSRFRGGSHGFRRLRRQASNEFVARATGASG